MNKIQAQNVFTLGTLQFVVIKLILYIRHDTVKMLFIMWLPIDIQKC